MAFKKLKPIFFLSWHFGDILECTQFSGHSNTDQSLIISHGKPSWISKQDSTVTSAPFALNSRHAFGLDHMEGRQAEPSPRCEDGETAAAVRFNWTGQLTAGRRSLLTWTLPDKPLNRLLRAPQGLEGEGERQRQQKARVRTGSEKRRDVLASVFIQFPQCVLCCVYSE